MKLKKNLWPIGPFDERFGTETADLKGISNGVLSGMDVDARILSDVTVIFNVGNQRENHKHLPANFISPNYKFEIVNEPQAGTITLLNDNSGKFSYQAPTGYLGETEFSYRVYDGSEFYSTDIPVKLIVDGSLSIEEDNNTANSTTLYQNYPNPFKPSTTISYEVLAADEINITVSNVKGEVVRETGNRRQETGKYSVKFDDSKLNSGIYFYSLKVNGATMSTKKMMLVK